MHVMSVGNYSIAVLIGMHILLFIKIFWVQINEDHCFFGSTVGVLQLIHSQC
jgi:hypothetical protein